MKTNLRGVTLAAILLSASNAVSQANDSDYYGDNEQQAAVVGDLPGYGEEAYYAESASYADASRKAAAASGVAQTAASESVGDAQTYYQAPAANPYKPVSFGTLQPSSFLQSGGACSSGACGGASCDGGCDSGCGSGRIGKVMSGCGDSMWMSAEALLWFPQDRVSPPLVSTAPGAGSDPALDQAGTAVFGPALDGGLSGGFRIDAGRYLTKGFGVGGRFWFMGDNSVDENRISDGTAGGSIGLPIFDTNPLGVGENSVIVAGTSSTGVVFGGNVQAESTLDMWGAEAYARMAFATGKEYSIDFLAGYSHFEVNDLITLRSNSIAVANPTPQTPIGTILSFQDTFDASNEFDGGQLGFESMLNRGRWSMRTLTKVHLGNMSRTLTATGAGTRDVAGVLTLNDGVYAQGVAGTVTNDDFSFIPEVNVKLGYRFRPNVAFSVGYSFLYFDNVALAGDHINRNVNSANLLGVEPNAAPVINANGLWVQGVDLGLVLTF